jgi:deoxyribodipyrimidine photo-lyase
MTTSIMWFRRDLRLSDNPALVQAASNADEVVALFVLDDALRNPSGPNRLAFLYSNLEDLNDRIDGHLVVRSGNPAEAVASVAREVDASQVFCAEDFGPYGRERDDEVEAALAKDSRTLERVDSNYAVEPGSVTKDNGEPFKVFTPFSRAWERHGWGDPVRAPKSVKWAKLKSEGVPAAPDITAELPKPGEAVAMRRARKFVDERVGKYDQARDFPARNATSRLSPYLKYGLIHPRQVLALLGRSKPEAVFRSELCWREFYADVLFHNPSSRDHALNESMKKMQLDTGKTADKRFDAWAAGKTGYPIVDAGMRQLVGEAYVHNRLRMVVASFLVKDLHVDWTRGARYFLHHLVDGDLASNNHGWQWVAGTGTDAAPYFRIFNPVTQGKRFDPDGEFIRKWVPELKGLDNKLIHEPWLAKDGIPEGYVERIVDHGEERKESLRRYQALR